MRWHQDGATGLLHLGITLGGRRKLHFRAGGKCHDSRMHDISMDSGNVYLSSPFLFDHRVSYEVGIHGGGSILALMCRFGFVDEDDALWVNHLHSSDVLLVAELISTCLRAATDKCALRLPSLDEVKNMEVLHGL